MKTAESWADENELADERSREIEEGERCQHGVRGCEDGGFECEECYRDEMADAAVAADAVAIARGEDPFGSDDEGPEAGGL